MPAPAGRPSYSPHPNASKRAHSMQEPYIDFGPICANSGRPASTIKPQDLLKLGVDSEHLSRCGARRNVLTHVINKAASDHWHHEHPRL